MSNINKPVLTWTLIFQPGVMNKLSYVPPYNICTVKFSCNKPFKKFMCRSTFENEEYGKDKGILIQEYSNRDADIELSFIINAINHLKNDSLIQDGKYRIGMYVQDTDGNWNFGQFFMVKMSGTSTYQKMITSDNKSIIVKEE